MSATRTASSRRCSPDWRMSPLNLPCLQRLPVDALLKCSGGAVNRLFVKGSSYQHHTDRQAVNQPTGEAHRRMVSAVESRRIGQHFEGALQYLATGALASGNGVATIGSVGISN